MRVPSDKPSPGKDGSLGWIHKLGSVVALPPLPKPRKRRPVDLADQWAHWRADTTPADYLALSLQLDVSETSLDRLGAAWAARHAAWAFPMHDSTGNMIGVRLRGTDGSKWAVTGSQNGLFIPGGLKAGAPDWLLVCEGPTDTAALLDLEFDAIGRASCGTGADFVIQYAKLQKRKNICIMADFDEPKKRPDGSTWRPGQEGAARLAEALTAKGLRPKIITPLYPHKDIRAWYVAGATRHAVLQLISNQEYWKCPAPEPSPAYKANSTV
jgi:hypothetical protein